MTNKFQVENISELIGNTPVVKSKTLSGDKKNVFFKLEYYNPAGSVKDRIALAMIDDAEEKGLLNKDTEIIEATSGNTGIGLAFIAAVKGYKLTLTMPESMSIERRKILRAYGANIILTAKEGGMKAAIEKANSLAKEKDNVFVPRQFDNKANPEIHYQTTGPELWKQSEGKIDFLIAGVGTGGTITGAGSYLKEKNKKIKVVAVEPIESAVLSGNEAGPHKIQGIGAGFIPSILNVKIYDEIIKVSIDDAIQTARSIASSEGILLGISSGAIAWAAEKIAEKNPEKNIYAIIPSNGERYLSTILFDEN
jgi:cysteine synthase A